MKPIQCGFKVSFVLSMIFLCVHGQLKFDADGNIIDDGLNLNIPAAPTVQKIPLVAKSKPQPLVVKSRPQPDRVVGNAETKGMCIIMGIICIIDKRASMSFKIIFCIFFYLQIQTPPKHLILKTRR